MPKTNKNELRRLAKIQRCARLGIQAINGLKTREIAAQEDINVSRVHALLSHGFRIATHPFYTPLPDYSHHDNLQQKRIDKDYWLIQLHKVLLVRPHDG